jgi:hypothetical protein
MVLRVGSRESQPAREVEEAVQNGIQEPGNEARISFIWKGKIQIRLASRARL